MPRTKAQPKTRTARKRKSLWTPERIEQIPAPYRNCLKAFYRIVLTRNQHYKIRRVPYSDLYTQLSYWHGYGVEETDRVAEELVRAGYIEGPDDLDFYAPTSDGDGLIKALLEYGRSGEHYVPAFPAFTE